MPIIADGRIDSLSVEFACDVADLTNQEIQNKAARLIDVQSAVVQGFLGSKKPQNGNGASASRENGNGNGAQARPVNGESPAVPARLVDVGGMNGKWGRRLFLNVEVIDYWKNSEQKQRWLATALLDIEPRLRRVRGHKHLPALRRALQEHKRRVEAERAVTPKRKKAA